MLSGAFRPAGRLYEAYFVAKLSELIGDERGAIAVIFSGWIYGGNSDQTAQPVNHLIRKLIDAVDHKLFRCRHVVTSTPEIVTRNRVGRVEDLARVQIVSSMICSRCQSRADCLFDCFAKRINVRKSRVDVWCNPYSFEFFVTDWRADDSILLPEMSAEFSVIRAFDAEIRQTAGLLRIVRSQDSNNFDRLEPMRPSIFQIPQPSRFALGADSFVKRESFGDRVVIRSRMRSDLFELSNIVVLFLVGSHQRPQFSD